MRLRSKLVHVAALLAASGCGGATTTGAQAPGDSGTGPDAAGDGGSDSGYTPGDAAGDVGADAAFDASLDVVCVGCGCNNNPPPTHPVSAAQACALLEEEGTYLNDVDFGFGCTQVCSPGYACELPMSFFMQVQALNPDGGVPSPDGGPDTLQCPATPTTVTITCLLECTGRLTAGYAAPRGRAPRDDGERLAAMSYLEAVSVHAFERLERELAAHGAPPSLLRDARRARRDEVRHTAMTARLARSRGGSPRRPEAPASRAASPRSLFEIALENAVEGCVRETYGAAVGLIEAQTSRDASLRRAMRSIADDECRHAELAWAVHAWAMVRLPAEEQRRVKNAMREAVAEIAGRDPRGAALLFSEDPTAIA
jgi:hypothetical protein